MYPKMCLKLLFVIAACSGSLVSADLTVNGALCGVKRCQPNDYCRDLDRTCQPCSGICDSSHHNFEASTCEKQCQDYLHDARYMRKDGLGSGNSEDLRNTVTQLSRMVTVTLTLVCLMLIVLAGVFCFQLYRWKIKKNITLASLKSKLFNKQASSNNEHPKTHNPMTPDNKKNDLRINMPSTRTNSDHSPVTVTTSISRRPAEDSTLDYAYDNPVMTSPR